MQAGVATRVAGRALLGMFALAAAVPLGSAALAASRAGFPNPKALKVPVGDPGQEGPASDYPSTVNATGVGTVDKVTVTVSKIQHTSLSDLDILLVGPTGVKVILMGHTSVMYYDEVKDLTYTFEDAAAKGLPQKEVPAPKSGAYKPTTYEEDTAYRFVAPAPKPPYKTTLAAFNGTNGDGVWRLYVYDTLGPYGGMVAGGWTLKLNAGGGPPPPSSDSLCDASPATITGSGKIMGTPKDDVIIGSDAADEIHGLAGNDRICGLGGDDKIYGEQGKNFIRGGDGRDSLVGGPGPDSIHGGDGPDGIVGDQGDDSLSGEGGGDIVLGGAGDDVLLGAQGKDTLNGLEGNDRIFGGADPDELTGSTGDDLIIGGPGNDRILGGPGDDTCEKKKQPKDVVIDCEHTKA